MEIKELACLGAKLLADKKASDVNIIEIGTKAAFADYFINATGNSQRQVLSLADEIEDRYAMEGILVKNIEGKNNGQWILLDFGDVIVNIFSKEMRERYCIEKIWGDCPITQIEE
ncbi:MAG: ribosome silencing factor [Clostridia bacterium]|nr:ribosome silencing factor [Clostridia bacterium]